MTHSLVSLRPAQADDLPQLVALSAARRARSALAQPVFWRVAPDADARQAGWFRHLLTLENVQALVACSGSEVLGFLVAQLVQHPPVYDPGGPTCAIDDFEVRDAEAWPGTGRQLLGAAQSWARERGAAQVVVVCGHHDGPKRQMLQDAGFPVASEWRVQALKEEA